MGYWGGGHRAHARQSVASESQEHPRRPPQGKPDQWMIPGFKPPGLPAQCSFSSHTSPVAYSPGSGCLMPVLRRIWSSALGDRPLQSQGWVCLPKAGLTAGETEEGSHPQQWLD